MNFLWRIYQLTYHPWADDGAEGSTDSDSSLSQDDDDVAEGEVDVGHQKAATRTSESTRARDDMLEQRRSALAIQTQPEQRVRRPGEVIPEQVRRSPGPKTSVVRAPSQSKSGDEELKFEKELKELLRDSYGGTFPIGSGEVCMILLKGLKHFALRKDTCYIDGHISEDEARKIRYFARSVTKLEVRHEYGQFADEPSVRIPFPTVLKLSTILPRNTPFFPNLQDVSVADWSDKNVAILPLLVSSSLRSVWLSAPFNDREARAAVSDFAVFLQLLSPVARNLCSVRIQYAPWGYLLNTLLPFKDSITHLWLNDFFRPPAPLTTTRVPCDVGCPVQVYSALNQFTRLERLELRLPSQKSCNCLREPSKTYTLKVDILEICTQLVDFNLALGLYRVEFIATSCLRIGLSQSYIMPLDAESRFWNLLVERVSFPPEFLIDSRNLGAPIPHSALEFFLKADNITHLLLRYKPAPDLNQFLVTQARDSKVYPGRVWLVFDPSNQPSLSLSSLLLMAAVFPNLKGLKCRVIPQAPPFIPAPIKPDRRHPLDLLEVVEYPKGSVTVSAKDTIAIARALLSTFPNLKAKRLSITNTTSEISGGPGIWEDIKEVMSFMEESPGAA